MLSTDGLLKTVGTLSKHFSRADIFQLQMYYYAAVQATRLDSLEGLRVLDVSQGQDQALKFIKSNLLPRALVGFDPVRRQFTTGPSSQLAEQT